LRVCDSRWARRIFDVRRRWEYRVVEDPVVNFMFSSPAVINLILPRKCEPCNMHNIEEGNTMFA
jgi:alpha-D-ribose 1-methylphosphonate 5-phosphate C-P lyase